MIERRQKLRCQPWTVAGRARMVHAGIPHQRTVAEDVDVRVWVVRREDACDRCFQFFGRSQPCVGRKLRKHLCDEGVVEDPFASELRGFDHSRSRSIRVTETGRTKQVQALLMRAWIAHERLLRIPVTVWQS